MIDAQAQTRLAEIEEQTGTKPAANQLELAIERLVDTAVDARRCKEIGAERYWLRLAVWLLELRGRRIAMGRSPDDERNAAGDLACPGCGGVLPKCSCVPPVGES